MSLSSIVVRLVTLFFVLGLSFPLFFAVRDLQTKELINIAGSRQENLDYDGWLENLRQAAKLQPGDTALQIKLGKAARTLWVYRNDPVLKAEADHAFQQATNLNPHSPWAAYEHAHMYLMKEDYGRALKLLETSIQRDPNNAAFWLERARYLTALKRFSEAKAAYEHCNNLRPNTECAREGNL